MPETTNPPPVAAEVEAIAEVLADHTWDMSDEQKVNGEWVWGVCCECGEFVPFGEENSHVAAAILASPALADLLARARGEAVAPFVELADQWQRTFDEANAGDDPVTRFLRMDTAAARIRDRVRFGMPDRADRQEQP